VVQRDLNHSIIVSMCVYASVADHELRRAVEASADAQ